MATVPKGKGCVPGLVRMEVCGFRRMGWFKRDEVRVKLFVDNQLNSDRWYPDGAKVDLTIHFEVT